LALNHPDYPARLYPLSDDSKSPLNFLGFSGELPKILNLDDATSGVKKVQ
jgi:hypothetical protein